MFVETAAVIEVSDELYLHMTGEHLYTNRSELQEEHKETTEKLQKLHTSKPKKKLPPVPKKQSRPPLPKSISEPILEEPEEIKPETPKRKELPLPQSKSFVIREPTKNLKVHSLQNEILALVPRWSKEVSPVIPSDQREARNPHPTDQCRRRS